MSQPTPTNPRPTQVTVAAIMIMIGSIFVVLMVWDRIAALHSLDSRRALQDFLDTPVVRGRGLAVSDLMAIVKTISMVGAGCATAMVILGYQTLRRSRGARLALTILAVPLFLCGLVTGGFVAAIVVAAVASLWLGPARLWFDGGEGARTPSEQTPVREQPRQQTPPHQLPPPPWTQQPPPHQQAGGAPPVWAPPPTSAYDVWGRPQARPAPRPAALLVACLIAWVVSALSLLTMIASVVYLAADTSSVLDAMHQENTQLADQGISDHTILVLAYVMSGLFVLWAVAAIVVTVFCFLGRRWAWYALVISSAVLVGFSVLGAIASLIMLLPLGAAVAVITLLSRSEVRTWMR